MEQTVMKSERELLLDLKNADRMLAAAQLAATEAAKAYDRAENALIEYMQAKNLKTTGKYNGIGSATLVKPRLYANYLKDNEELVFKFLKDVGRGDLIKETVNKNSLSGFVKEMLENPDPEKPIMIPDVETEAGVIPLISFHLQPSIKINES